MPYALLTYIGIGVALIFMMGVYPNGRSLIRDGDMRAIIALILIAGCVTLSVLDIWLKGGNGGIPDWLLGFAGPIVGYFYRDQSAARDADRVSDTAVKVATEATKKASDSMTIHDAKKVETKHGSSGGGE